MHYQEVHSIVMGIWIYENCDIGVCCEIIRGSLATSTSEIGSDGSFLVTG